MASPTPKAILMPLVPRRFLPALVGTLSLVSFVGARAQAPKPVPGVPYQYWDVLEADGGARKVYIRNDGAAPMTVTQVVVQICDNTRQLCGTYPSNLVVAPGKTVEAFKVERFDRKLAWRFAYSFRTHVEGGPPPGFAVPDQRVMTMTNGGVVSVVSMVPVDSIVTSVPPLTEGAACGHITIVDLPPGHRGLLMIFGTATRPVARQVTVRLDGNGAAYDYNDLRWDPSDTSRTPAQTQISLDLVRQTVMVRNTGGTAPATFFRSVGPSVATAQTLDNPSGMIARMVKECGGQ